MQNYVYGDIGGGRNKGLPPYAIKDNEFQDLYNFIPFGTKIVRRGGTKLLSTVTAANGYQDQFSSLHPYKTNAGVYLPLVGGYGSLATLQGGQLAPIQSSDGTVLPTSDLPWVFFSYKGIAYAMRRMTGTLLRTDGTFFEKASISAPLSAPTLAQGAAGALAAGNYAGVVTFYNTLTGAESLPSPVSGSLSLGSLFQINWSGIPTSSQRQVNARRLYRTLLNQTGQYFFMGMLNDNLTTTFTGDNVLPQNLGAPVSFHNGLSPNNLAYGAMFKERLFCTDEQSLFYSELGLPECFDPNSVILVFPNDGHQIRGIIPFGERLVVAKTNKIHYLIGTDPSSFNLLTLSDKHGCASHYSLAVAEGQLFWFGTGATPSLGSAVQQYTGPNFYRTDGNNVTELGSVKIRDILDKIPESRLQYVVATVFPALNLYVAVVPQVDGPNGINQNALVLVYNYKTDAWSIFDHAQYGAPAFIMDFFDANYGHLLYASFYDGNIYLYNDPLTNSDFIVSTGGASGGGGNPVATVINARFNTKAYNFGSSAYSSYIGSGASPANKRAIQRAYLYSKSYNEMISLQLVRDRGINVGSSRSVSLNWDQDWKVYNMPGLAHPSGIQYLNASYTGLSRFELEALAFDVLLYSRMDQPR